MKLDDFDAVFRSAVKDRFTLAPPTIAHVVIVTDMLPGDAAAFETTAKRMLAPVLDAEVRWRTVGEDEFKSVDELLELLEAAGTDRPVDLIVTYRHLLGRRKDLLYSLGSVVDTLTQVLSAPVLLVPPPTRANFDLLCAPLARVLVVTDHLSGDDRLVNWGARMTPPGGGLFLAHVEDQHTFERYMELIGMVPDIDTETTRARLADKLLGRPRDYIAHIAEVLSEDEGGRAVTPIVTMADALSDYRRLVDEHDINLLVMNTKDANQLAMHGMAYAISVEIQGRPLLLL